MILKVFSALLFIFFSTNICFADTTVQTPQAVTAQITAQQAITTPQNIAYANCTKMFTVNKEKLFYLTLGGISANNFTIEEIQTENGYVIFSAAENKYLATIAGIDAQNSILKITPCNDIYFFPPGIFLNMFRYIDLNINTSVN